MKAHNIIDWQILCHRFMVCWMAQTSLFSHRWLPCLHWTTKLNLLNTWAWLVTGAWHDLPWMPFFFFKFVSKIIISQHWGGSCQPSTYVSGLCEETGVPKGIPQRECTNSMHTWLMWESNPDYPLTGYCVTVIGNESESDLWSDVLILQMWDILSKSQFQISVTKLLNLERFKEVNTQFNELWSIW